MFDLLLTPAAFLHAFALLFLLFFAARRWRVPRKDAPFFVLILAWIALVVTSHLAGIGSHLGSLAVYVPVSFLALAFTLAYFAPLARAPALPPLVAPPVIAFAPLGSPKARRALFWFFGGTLALFALISLILGQGVYPDNADSMIYRLPRAFWYVSNGSLLHPFDALDRRLIFYPLDGIALYIPLVLYGLPGTFHAAPSLLSWLVIVFAAYRFARELGGDRLIALIAAWLIGLTPSVLAQATSTNDEILAAAAMLTCFLMAWRWMVTGRPLYFMLAAAALSLSAGTKMHILFLTPTFALFLLTGLVAIKRKPERFGLWLRTIGWKNGLMSLALVAGLFTPFLFYNYASCGRFYFFDEFKGDVFNLTSSLQAWFQNLLIYLGQMIVSPIGDLNAWPVANDRQHFNDLLNQIFFPLIDPLIDKNPRFYHMTYRFVGVTLPVSVRFVEFSLWSAFVWLLWPWQAALALKQKAFPLRGVFAIFALTPPLWLLFWSFVTLYMEGTATYFSYYLICAAPASAFVLARMKSGIANELRWIAVIFVVLTNLIVANNLVMFSGFRALPDLVYAKKLPYDWLLSEQPIIDEIRAAKTIRIVFTHEKLPYFGYMHWNPRATYLTPHEIKDPKLATLLPSTLQIVPASSLFMYGFMPLKIPGKLTPGMTFLGNVRAIGREAIFAVGNGVEKRHPQESNYIVLTASMAPAGQDGKWPVTLSETPYGFSPDDNLTFEYELKANGQTVLHRPADKNPGLRFALDRNPQRGGLTLTTTVRSAWSGKELTRVTYPLGGPGAWLPDGGEY